MRRINFCLEKSKTNALITQQKLLMTCGSIAFVFRILKIKLDVVSLLFFYSRVLTPSGGIDLHSSGVKQILPHNSTYKAAHFFRLASADMKQVK